MRAIDNMTFESSQVYRAKVDFDAGFLGAEFHIRVIEARTRSLKSKSFPLSKSFKITGVSLYLKTNLRRIIIIFYVILLLLLRQPKAEAVKEVRQLLATSHRVQTAGYTKIGLVLLLLLAMEPVQIACFCLHTSFNVGPTNSLGVDILDEKRLTKSRNPFSTSVQIASPKDNELLDGLEIEKNGNWKFVFSLRSSSLGGSNLIVMFGGDYYTVGIVPGEPRQWPWLFAFAAACMYIESSTSKQISSAPFRSRAVIVQYTYSRWRDYISGMDIQNLSVHFILSIFILQPAPLGFDDGREASGWLARINKKKKRIAKIVVVTGTE